ncbi:hypothetical protein PRUPE_6G189200 [Prunus persica]|uniref:Uncharacterized protein n=1 Tax=Prunus persica TaxID=3760 RepID=A0A251NU86_PRUPE|nr:hypothetical protein PRUPE_6G189200 [Prunus persica]
MLPSLLGSPCLVYHIMLAVLFSVIIQILQAVAEILLIPITQGRKRHNKKPKEAQSFNFFFMTNYSDQKETQISSTHKMIQINTSKWGEIGEKQISLYSILLFRIPEKRKKKKKKKKPFFFFPDSLQDKWWSMENHRCDGGQGPSDA